MRPLDWYRVWRRSLPPSVWGFWSMIELAVVVVAVGALCFAAMHAGR